ncbi:MAG: group II intron maturase-specific domain-containing protein, partial [Planctomycetia bacterium]|nr:group II intron maturase-specific domain-containing protein [Planctomycetia bacterium]
MRRRVPAETFDFLGYTFGRCYSKKTGRAYIGSRPSKTKIRKLCDSVSEMTSQRTLNREPEEVIKRLNRRLVGWSGYFRLGPVSPAYRAVD